MYLFGGGSYLGELRVVVIVICLIAAIAIPKLMKAGYVAAMRSDLEELASLQEAYHADHGSYATSLDEVGFTPSAGVAIMLGESGANGWAASATHADWDDVKCAYSGGTMMADNSTAAATDSGGVVCNQ